MRAQAKTGRPLSLITVMTCQDAGVLIELLKSAAKGSRRHMPAGIRDEADLRAAMAGGLAFLAAYRTPVGGRSAPVGAIAYRWDHGALRIQHVAVREEARGGGVARRMVEAVENVATALGAPRIAASAGTTAGDQAFLERLGYEGYGSGERVPMTKPLES
ncbi:MAG: GNAT family N-acetyltransferase [Candidatus Sericytochromatia bacterium]|nr:GNAT family N-acetyltransferase [Candidatus Sericytochromatia bacterium]